LAFEPPEHAGHDPANDGAVVADKGYFKIEHIEACEKAGMVPYMPRPQRGPSVKTGPYPNTVHLGF